MKNLAELLQVNEEPLPRLYCDMDQVLVAFLNGAKQITGQDFQKMNRDTRWKTISNAPRFWENLQFCHFSTEEASKIFFAISTYHWPCAQKS